MLWFKSSRSIAALDEDLKSLRRDFQALELEWGNVYDKLRRAMGRIVKSRAIIEEKEQQEEGSAAPLPMGMHGTSLTPHQMQLQRQIMRRRAGG